MGGGVDGSLPINSEWNRRENDNMHGLRWWWDSV